MGAFIADYGLFLLEFVTVTVVIVIAVVLIISAARKPHEHHELAIENINESLEHRADIARRQILGRREFRQLVRARKKEKKAESDKDSKTKRRVFVIDFKGDIRATATASLREEVTTVIGLAEKGDEVLLRLDNAGGEVHAHGLAASQLLRLRSHGVKLTVAGSR